MLIKYKPTFIFPVEIIIKFSTVLKMLLILFLATARYLNGEERKSWLLKTDTPKLLATWRPVKVGYVYDAFEFSRHRILFTRKLIPITNHAT